MTLGPDDAGRERRSADEAAMWCDLLLGHLTAQYAHFEVTRRAELYIRVAALPLDRVLDALKIDQTGWTERLTDLRAMEQRNREAAAASDPATARDSGAEAVP